VARAIGLRRLTPADAPHMSDLLQRLSPQSRYLRYFRPVRSFAPADIARFVATGPSHLAVGAFDAGVLVGVAQYFRSTCHDRAELALEVADSHHGRGLGGRLVHELARLAADAGITHFTATVLAENRAVLALIRHSGWEVVTTVDGPYTDIVVSLPPALVRARATCRQA
jgi:RimJ/RimL family protein N-acetyltransferase